VSGRASAPSHARETEGRPGYPPLLMIMVMGPGRGSGVRIRRYFDTPFAVLTRQSASE
jgi:hypothetical protein